MGLASDLAKEYGVTTGAAVTPPLRPGAGVATRLALEVQKEKAQAPAAQAEAAPEEKPLIDVQLPKFEPAPLAKDFSVTNALARAALSPASMLASAVGASETGIEISNYMNREFPAKTGEITSTNAADIPTFIAERAIENLGNWGVMGASTVAGASAGQAAGGPRGAVVGGLVGAAASAFGLSFGEARQEVQQTTGADDALAALPAGTANTAFELAPLGRVAKKLGVFGPVEKAIQDTILENKGLAASIRKTITDIGKETAIGVAKETPTELIQEFNLIATSKILQDKDILALDRKDVNRLINAAAAGAAGGSVHGPVITIGERVLPLFSKEAREAATDPRADMENVLSKLQAEVARYTEVLEKNAVEREAATAGNLWDTQDLEKATGLNGAAAAKTVDIPLPGQNAPINLDRSIPWEVERQTEDGNPVMQKYDETQHGEGEVMAIRTPDVTDEQFTRMKAVAEQLNSFTKELGLKKFRAVLYSTTAENEIRRAYNAPQAKGELGSMIRTSSGVNLIAVHGANSAKFAQGTNLADAVDQETAFHEYGHAIIQGILHDAADRDKLALMNGYGRYLKQLQNGTYRDYAKSSKLPAMRQLQKESEMGQRGAVKMSSYLKGLPKKNQSYIMSADEWFANQFGRYATNRLTGGKLTIAPGYKKVFSGLYDTMKKLHRLIRRETKTSEPFAAFLDRALALEKISKLQAGIEAYAEATDPRVAAEERALKAEIAAEGIITAQNEIRNKAPFMNAEVPLSGLETTDLNILDKLGFSRESADIKRHKNLQLGFAKMAKLLTPIQLAELSAKVGFMNPQEYMVHVRQWADTKTKAMESINTLVTDWKGLGQKEAEKLSSALFEISEESDRLGRQLNDAELKAIFDRYQMDEKSRAMWATTDASFREVLDRMEAALIIDTARVYLKSVPVATADGKTRMPTPDEVEANAQAFRQEWATAQTVQEKAALIEKYTGKDFFASGGKDALDQLIDNIKNGNKEKTVINPFYDELVKIGKSVQQLRGRNYFPRTRLGRYLIRVTATEKGQIWEGYEAKRAKEVIGFYGFDTKAERDTALKDWAKEAKLNGVSMNGEIAETELFALSAMPQVLIDKISSEMELTKQQKHVLDGLSINMSPGRKFVKHLQKRKGIDGFSLDAMRVYTNYMTHANNHIARVEHSRPMLNALGRIDAFLADKRENTVGLQLDELVKLRDYFWRHFDYIMKSDNDWASLRAMAFVLYLGFNIKSAMVNLTQLPLITGPVLAGRFGDISATKELVKAIADVPKLIFTDSGLSAEEKAYLQVLREQGVIDESFVSEIAGLGEANVLQRNVPFMSDHRWGRKIISVANKTAYYSGTMFRVAEKYNRLVTALAVHRLVKKRNGSEEDALKTARWAIESSQFEYAKWNRAEFMRGKKGILTIFQAYTQHASFLFFGGQGKGVAARMMIMGMLASGPLGLPGAELILDLIDALGTWIRKIFGAEDPRVATRDWMRSLLVDITDRPDLFMHGLGRYYGLGPIHALNLFGVPIPDIDISGSLSYGYLIPGAKEFMHPQKKPDETLGRTVASAAGPLLAYPYNIYKAMMSTGGDSWKTAEKVMPVAMRNLSTGVRWGTEGRETFRNDGTLVDFTNVEGRIAAALKAAGFQPTRLSQTYENIGAKAEAKAYYTTRRALLLQDYYLARAEGPEEVANVRKEIALFNKGVTADPALRGFVIRGKDLVSSVKTRARAVRAMEHGVEVNKRNRPLGAELDKLYPVSE